MAGDVSIRLALGERLASLVLAPALPIAWENDDFDPPADGSAWLDVQLFRSDSRRWSINGDTHEAIGFLQVAVMTWKGRAAVAPDLIAEAVQAHFPADLRLFEGDQIVAITERPEIGSGLPDGPWWRVPVTVRWRSSIST